MNTNAISSENPTFASQKDVAAEAGVSQSTVHRVFANHPSVSEAVGRRVNEVAERLGYVPNLHARRLRLGRHESIAVVMGFAASRLPEERLTAISHGLQNTHYGLSLVRLPDEALTDPKYMLQVRHRLAFDGILMNYTNDIPEGLLSSIRSLGVPTVWTNINWPVDCVYVDDYSVTQDLVQYLYDLGHRSIAGLNLAGHSHYGIAAMIRGYQDAATKLGLKVNLADCIVARPDRPEFLRRWLADAERPTAVVAASPAMAFPLIRVAVESGLRVPQDLSVACLSVKADSDLGGWQLTHMRHPEDKVGECSVRMLMQKLSGGDEPMPSIGLRCRLMEGETTCRR